MTKLLRHLISNATASCKSVAKALTEKGLESRILFPRPKIVVCAIVATSFVTVAAQTYLVDQDETVAKADSLFGQRYNSTYEQGRGWGSPEGPIYWFNAAYVVRLLFANDGSLARLELKPEAFLHGQMSATGVKLGASDFQWFLKAANQPRPLGHPADVHKPPLCF